MTRPRIAIVTCFPSDPGQPSGGVESVSATLVEYLARDESMEWHVVTQDPRVSAPVVETWQGATVHRLPRPKVSTLTNAVGPGRRRIQDYLAALRPQLIHSHDTYGMMLKGIPPGVPRIFTVHGFIHRDTLVSGLKLPWLRSRIWRRFELSGWADQDRIISISPYVREFVSGHTKAIIHDIDNPIREDFFELPRAEVHGRVFSAAEISPRKNTLVLVQAIEILRAAGVRVELRLAGKVAHDGYGAALDRYIDGHGLSKDVVRLGLVPYDRVRDELRSASVFALVSLEENSPMGIEEAMAAGVPVVTSNRCGMPYLVRDGTSGFLVDPVSPGEVAERLGAILGDPALAARLASASRATALERFHPTRVAERTLEVYRRTLTADQASGGPAGGGAGTTAGG